MSANDYYGQKPLPTFPQSSESSEYYGGGHQQQQQQQQQPYQQQGPSLYSTPSQSQSGYGGYGGGYGGGSTGDRPPQGKTSPSPFETVFDDHVYPASSHQTPAASRDHLSQQDTGYHSLARVSDEDLAHNHPADDIPLQNTKPSRNNSFKDPEMQDHVYDAPQQGQKKSKKRGVRFGELGMLGANSKRIPWVCYIFTVAQIGVFIGEVIKNGKHQNSPLYCPIPCVMYACLTFWDLPRHSYVDRLSYHDAAVLQPNDWPLNIRSDQHGCSFRPLYA